MKFPDRFLEEVKGRFRLSEVIGRSVPLKRAGNEMVGLSPFQNEKTPSFYVNDAKAFFHDFSSGTSGDVFDWTMHAEGLGFIEAVKRLAQEAGVPLPEGDARTEQAEHRRRQLENLLAAAQAFFQRELAQSAEATAYLQRRGLSAEDIARFGVGYAPDSRFTMLAMLNGRPEDIAAAGLVVTPEDGGRPFDRYRHRITFPIYDASGRLISFGARALDPKARAKYLNGPDTELFDKSRHLYGLSWARKMLIGAAAPLAVVEGYLDVIACQRAGIAACATMGTSLTISQLELMWRFHPEPTLCFDADPAGRRAAGRAMDLALPKLAAGRSLRFSLVTGGKDPDDVLRDQGPGALRAQILKATPLSAAIFAREHAAGPLDTPEQRTEFRERLHKIVRAIPDRGLAREYGDAFARRLEVLRKAPAERPASTDAVAGAKALREAIPPARAALGYWLVRDPARAHEDLELISERGLGHAALDRLAGEVVPWLMDGGDDGERLAQHLNARGLGELVVSLADPEERLADRTAWRAAYRALAGYLDLERAVEEAKAAIRTADDMRAFNALKSQRDAARRAL